MSRDRRGRGRGSRLALFAGLVAALAAAPAAAQLTARPILRLDGLQAGDGFGRAVARAGDVNGDGFADFLVGAPFADGTNLDMGVAYLFLGGARLDSISDAVLPGRNPSGHAGATIASAGDVNGDGCGDWLVGAPDYTTSALGVLGRVWLYHGGAQFDAVSERSFDSPPAVSPTTQFGSALCGIGDYNADGIGDFLLSGTVPGGMSSFVYFGGPTLSRSPDLPLQTLDFGIVRAGATGDVNGDGWPDILLAFSGTFVSSPGNVQIFFGGPGADAVADRTYQVFGSGEGPGITISSGGDVNGDGFTDFAVGALQKPLGATQGVGEVMVYFGGPGLDEFADVRIPGSAVGEYCGHSVAIQSDLDDDGYDDVVIGAPGSDARGLDAGRVYVKFGGTATGVRSPDLFIDGEAAGDQFGFSVAAIGDPDLAGRDAFVVGAFGSDARAANAGRAVVYRVSRFDLLSPSAADRWEAGGVGKVEWRGSELADVDLSLNDGTSWQRLASGAGGLSLNSLELPVPDVVSGRARLRLTLAGATAGAGRSAFSSGRFRIVRSAPKRSASLRSEAATIPAAGLPGTIATGVDWNGDGIPDRFAGAPDDGDGRVVIQVDRGGASPNLVLRGFSPLERFGAAVLDAGDFDGDGWHDLAVGAPSSGVAGPDAGRVYLFRGGPSSDGQPDLVIDGVREGERLGASLAAAGDVNGDARADLAAGAPAGGEEGRVYVYFGGAGADATADEILSSAVAGPFGAGIAGVGDVNGDGRGDLLVSGMPYSGSNGANVVHLYFGAATHAGWRQMWISGPGRDDGFGAALAGLGDLDGDGLDDFAIGSPLETVSGYPAVGCVRVYFGSTGFLPVSGLTITGHKLKGQFGASIAGGADLNGDGRDDFAVGSTGDESTGLSGASIAVFFGDDPFADGFAGGEDRTRFGAAVAIEALPGESPLGSILVGAPFAGGGGSEPGRVSTIEVVRWHFRQSRGPNEWLAGSRHTLSWDGTEPADVWFVGEPGETQLAAAVTGGHTSSHVTVTLDPSLPDSGAIELRPTNSSVRGRARLEPVKLLRVVQLRRFEWEAQGEGVALRWATDPPVGTGVLSGYRLWRIGAGNRKVEVGSSLLLDSTAVDAGGSVGDRYELVAVTTTGVEYVAGEFVVPGPAAEVRAWPQPAGERGEVHIEFVAPRAGDAIASDLDASIYDVRGRRVRRLAGGRPGTRAGLVELTWDGTSERGARAGPGVYFLRVRAPSANFEKVRRLVLLDNARP